MEGQKKFDCGSHWRWVNETIFGWVFFCNIIDFFKKYKCVIQFFVLILQQLKRFSSSNSFLKWTGTQNDIKIAPIYSKTLTPLFKGTVTVWAFKIRLMNFWIWNFLFNCNDLTLFTQGIKSDWVHKLMYERLFIIKNMSWRRFSTFFIITYRFLNKIHTYMHMWHILWMKKAGNILFCLHYSFSVSTIIIHKRIPSYYCT